MRYEVMILETRDQNTAHRIVSRLAEIGDNLEISLRARPRLRLKIVSFPYLCLAIISK